VGLSQQPILTPASAGAPAWSFVSTVSLSLGLVISISVPKWKPADPLDQNDIEQPQQPGPAE